MTASTSATRPRRRLPRAGDTRPARRGTRFHHLFLSRYTVATKLLVAAGFLLLPLGLFAAYFVSERISTLREAGAERSGTLLYRPVDRLIWDVAAHSEAESLGLSAGDGGRERSDALLTKAAADLHDFEALEHTRGNIETHEILARLESSFAALKVGPSRTVAESLTRHGSVLDAAFELGELIGSECGLFRDPDAALSNLSDVTFREIPRVVRNVAELRARLAFDSPDPAAREANRMRMVELASTGIDRSIRSREELQAAVDMPGHRGELHDDIHAELGQWNERILPWLTHLSTQLIAGDTPSGVQKAALTDSIGMYQSLETVHDRLTDAAERAVLQREAAQRHIFWAAVVSTFLTVFTGGLLIHAISTRTAGGVRRLLFISRRIAEGEYNQSIDERGADEISQLFAGFAEMQRRLTLQIGTERSQLVINTRIRAALDNVAGSVIVAAASGAIVHINRSADAMLTGAEPDIRSRIPEFSAADLHGNPLEPLCEALVGEPMGLMSLDGTLVREFVAGSRTFRLVVNPILAESGERFGVVVEWSDRTSEVAVEQELQGMLKAVIDGALDRRIELAGKRGFFETMGRGVNELTGQIANVVLKVKFAAGEVWRGAQELSEGNTNLAQRTETQLASLERTTALMKTMTETAQRGSRESTGDRCSRQSRARRRRRG